MYSFEIFVDEQIFTNRLFLFHTSEMCLFQSAYLHRRITLNINIFIWSGFHVDELILFFFYEKGHGINDRRRSLQADDGEV